MNSNPDTYTRTEIEAELRRYAFPRHRHARPDRSRRRWLFSVLGWMDRTGRDVFARSDLAYVRERLEAGLLTGPLVSGVPQ